MRRLLIAAVVVLLGCGPALVWEGRTADRRDFVRVVEDGSGQRVVVAGRSGRRYGGVGIEELTFSSDGRHLAYPARVGEQWTVVRDGRELGRWSAVGELRFAPGGRRLVFSAERNGRWHVVEDEQSGPAFEAIFAGTLQWSADGNAFAYAGTRAGLAHVAWNRTLGPGFAGVARLTLGARGRRLLYAGRRDDGWHLVDGDRVGPAHEAMVELALSPDERHVAYVASGGGRQGLVVDGVELPSYQGGRVSWLSIDDRGRLTFAAIRPDAACVVRHGVAQPVFDQVSKLVDRGSHYAYVGQLGERASLLVDGKVIATADAVEDLVAAPDGARFAALLRRGQRWSVLCDGREHAFDRAIAGSLAFGRDGRHFGVVAGEASSRRIFIAIDGVGRRPLDMRELVSLAEKRPEARPEEATRALQALVAAEVDLATAGRSTDESPSVP